MNETCPACGGRQLVYDEPCPTCHGTRPRALSARTIQARIPAGVKDGQRIRLRGKGAAGENGGPAGDLYVVVRCRRTGSSAARATTSPSTCRSPSTRPRSAPRSRSRPSAARRSPSRSRPARPTAAPSGSAARAPRKADGTHGDLLATVEVQVPAVLDHGRPRGRRGLPRRDRRQAAARQPLRGSLT